MSELNHTVTGDPRSPAIVFLHGFMGSSEDWRALTEALDDRFRCLAVDLPGHGVSVGLPPETYTIEGVTRALLGLFDELGIERPVLAGYSMGGRLALYLALRHPQRCAGLFLESASPGIEDAAERAARRSSDEKMAERLESGDFEAFVRDWYGQPLFASLARNEDLLQKIVEARLRNDPQELARSLRGLGTGCQPSLWEELPGLRGPALVSAGELDAKYVGVARRMAEASSRIRAVVFQGVGHNIHAEARDAYLELLLSCLT